MGSYSYSIGYRGNNFKVVLLGEGAVGKTSLVLRFVENKFSEKHVTTLQASFLTKRLDLEGERINLSIWDTAGQEKFYALGPIYYRDSHGAVLVYDITNEASFHKVKNWVHDLRKILGEEICLVVAGNKCDLSSDRKVSEEAAVAYCCEVGAYHYNTSAKTDSGVDELFLDLCAQMLEVSRNQEAESRRGSTSGIEIGESGAKSGKTCCSF